MRPLLNNIPLSGKTTFKIGGPALYYCAPESPEEVGEVSRWARNNAMPVFVLGKGSNLLVSDKGWNGLVIDMSEKWTGILWNGDNAECRSGALLHTLVRESVERGVTGLEKLAGIPGSVGGAVVMNAGAFGQSISDCLASVRFLSLPDGALKTLRSADINASYRNTIFKTSEAIILSTGFRFPRDSAGTARTFFDEVLAKRKDRHPLDLPNCGSVFKNPPETTAGKLIEQCGLKGMSSGAAQVSPKHANFIVNNGGASAADVRALIVYVQKTVYGKTGVLLEPEVVFVGDFDEPLINEF
jgi:UDP-N-acetylmuramate dehydrogenase